MQASKQLKQFQQQQLSSINQLKFHLKQQLKLAVPQIVGKTITIKQNFLREVHKIQEICCRFKVQFDITKIFQYLNCEVEEHNLIKTDVQLAKFLQKQKYLSLSKFSNSIQQKILALNSVYNIVGSYSLKGSKIRNIQQGQQIWKLQKFDIKNSIFMKAINLWNLNCERQSNFQSVQPNTTSQLQKQKVYGIIQKVILKLEQQIFIKSIVAIQQLDNDENDTRQSKNCKVYLEQCYPSIIKNKLHLIKVLGQKRFLYYRQNFEDFLLNQKLPGSIYDMFKLCHNCSKIIKANFLNDNQCNINHTLNAKQNFFQIYLYPELYYQRIFKFKFQSSSSKRQLQMIPFFFSFQNISIGCSRILCLECDKTLKKSKTINCLFCQGVCSCKRCTLADKLSKLIGYWGKQDKKWISQTIKQFNMIF